MTRRVRIAVIWTTAVVLLAIGTFLQARADTDAVAVASPMDIAAGDRLAHTLCINCHVVDSRGTLVRTDRVPSFPWIAQQPGLTQDFLTGWLSSSTSHERMPDYSLTREEIRQLSAYIVSLRKQ